MTIDWHVGDVVRKLREARRWNQKRLATVAKINKATIVSVEENAPGTKRETYEKIAVALRMSLGELFSMVPMISQAPPPEDVEVHIGVAPEDVQINFADRMNAMRNEIRQQPGPDKKATQKKRTR